MSIILVKLRRNTHTAQLSLKRTELLQQRTAVLQQLRELVHKFETDVWPFPSMSYIELSTESFQIKETVPAKCASILLDADYILALLDKLLHEVRSVQNDA
jgi:hypothetical protein